MPVRSSPDHFCRSNILKGSLPSSLSSGINRPVLQKVFIRKCNFTFNDFLQYPGIRECLHNGLGVEFAGFTLVVTSEFLWIFLHVHRLLSLMQTCSQT